jgi:hypothetical protein
LTGYDLAGTLGRLVAIPDQAFHGFLSAFHAFLTAQNENDLGIQHIIYLIQALD